MAKPSDAVRVGTYLRDGGRCVVCGSTMLTYQHRKSTGMGGSKIAVDFPDGCAACLICNQAFEASMQTHAFLAGWKLKGRVDPETVPLLRLWERQWVRLHEDQAEPISPETAWRMLVNVYGEELPTQWLVTVGQSAGRIPLGRGFGVPALPSAP